MRERTIHDRDVFFARQDLRVSVGEALALGGALRRLGRAPGRAVRGGADEREARARLSQLGRHIDAAAARLERLENMPVDV